MEFIIFKEVGYFLVNGGGGGKLKLCTIADLKYGRWVSVELDTPPYTPMMGEVQQKTCPDFRPTESFNTFHWEPHMAEQTKCIFQPFSAESYCQIMNNRTAAIVGDSTSFDHYLSLTHLLGIPQSLPRARKKDALLISNICNNRSRLVGKRDFYLESLSSIIEQFSPDVLVLNRGAHYTPDDELKHHMVDTVFPILQEWQTTCKIEGKLCELIWRTTVPGHPNCTSFSQPSANITEMEELVSSAATINPTYNWDRFKGQNELMLNELKKTSLNYEVMDAYEINILRPDMHPSSNDCLHTCLPKDNTYSWLMHHMLHVMSGASQVAN